MHEEASQEERAIGPAIQLTENVTNKFEQKPNHLQVFFKCITKLLVYILMNGIAMEIRAQNPMLLLMEVRYRIQSHTSGASSIWTTV